jgi:hypothetical protein
MEQNNGGGMGVHYVAQTPTTTTATPDGKGELLVECAALRSTSKLGSPVNDGSSLSIPTAALIV